MLDTTFLKFIAILLITNSHLDSLYPITAMGAGGQLGNSLFFMLSGYGLVASYQKKGDIFLPWLRRRLARIYPPVFLVTIGAALITGTFFDWTFEDYIKRLLWPTNYWFVSCIVLFYLPFYWLMQRKQGHAFPLLMVAVLVPYFYFYFTVVDLTKFSIEDSLFKWLFYFQVMLLGGYLAYRPDSLKSAISTQLNASLLAIFLVAYFAVKLMIAKEIATELQFLIHWITFPIMVFSLRAMDTTVVRESIMKSPLAPFIALVAGATLEIYLLQKYVYGHPAVFSLGFPYSVIVFWPVVIVSGIVLAWLSTKIARQLAGRRSGGSAIPTRVQNERA